MSAFGSLADRPLVVSGTPIYGELDEDERNSVALDGWCSRSYRKRATRHCERRERAAHLLACREHIPDCHRVVGYAFDQGDRESTTATILKVRSGGKRIL